MMQWSRREFMTAAGCGLGTIAWAAARAADAPERLAFYLIGDTHYLASNVREGGFAPRLIHDKIAAPLSGNCMLAIMMFSRQPGRCGRAWLCAWGVPWTQGGQYGPGACG